MTNFTVYIPVGPDERDPDRLVDLVDGLAFYEPTVSWIVIVDDSPDGRSLENMLRVPPNCQLAALPNPRKSRHIDKLGALSASNMIAYEFIRTHCFPDFVLKVDTDALIIAPFADKIRQRFDLLVDVGMLGLLGNSCNRALRSFRSDERFMQILRNAASIAAQLNADRNVLPDEMSAKLVTWGIVTESQINNFVAASQRLSPLIESEFKGSHCQGGAYAVSGEAIARMSNCGFFSDPHIWMEIPFPEDKLMGAFCFLAGMSVADFSEPGEPFGVQAYGIAYAPEELRQMGYSLIHSIKNDPRYSEQAIREYYRSQRGRPFDYSSTT
jgi:hypothetical protein